MLILFWLHEYLYTYFYLSKGSEYFFLLIIKTCRYNHA